MIRSLPSGERREYLIDGFRVAFLHQAEWQCACREFSAAGTCRHVREAAGMRAAQAIIQRRLSASVSDFLPHARGLPARHVGTQPYKRPVGGCSEFRPAVTRAIRRAGISMGTDARIVGQGARSEAPGQPV